MEARGFGVQVTSLFLCAERNRLARLATLVTHLAVFLLLGGVLLNQQLGWRAELVIPPGGMADVGHGTGLRIANAGFAIERYPDGTIADYVATVRVQDAPAGIRLSAPLVRQGVGLYLRGYQPMDDGAALTLLAAHDPGYPAVVLAGFLLLLGLTVTFTFPVCQVQACLSADGVLHLGGWADRQACDFGREFAALVATAGGLPC